MLAGAQQIRIGNSFLISFENINPIPAVSKIPLSNFPKRIARLDGIAFQVCWSQLMAVRLILI